MDSRARIALPSPALVPTYLELTGSAPCVLHQRLFLSFHPLARAQQKGDLQPRDAAEFAMKLADPLIGNIPVKALRRTDLEIRLMRYLIFAVTNCTVVEHNTGELFSTLFDHKGAETGLLDPI